MEAAFDKNKYPQYAMTIDWVIYYREKLKKLKDMTYKEVLDFWMDLDDLRYYPMGKSLFYMIYDMREAVSRRMSELEVA
jgi:hypothetical protein